MSRLDSRLLRALDDWLFPERVAACAAMRRWAATIRAACALAARRRFPASPVKLRRFRRPQVLTRRLPRFPTPTSPVS